MLTFRPLRFLLLTALVVLWGPLGHAQSSLAGDWEGTLDAGNNQVHIVWHVTAAADGTLTSTFDNKDEGVNGIKAKVTELKDSKITVTVDDQIDVNGSAVNIRGTFVGTVSSDGNEVTGSWTQTDPEPQGPMELNFKRSSGQATPAKAPQG